MSASSSNSADNHRYDDLAMNLRDLEYAVCLAGEGQFGAPPSVAMSVSRP
jgi:hypothetical protein